MRPSYQKSWKLCHFLLKIYQCMVEQEIFFRIFSSTSFKTAPIWVTKQINNVKCLTVTKLHFNKQSLIMSSSEANQMRNKPLCEVSIYRHFSYPFVDKASVKDEWQIKCILITIKSCSIKHKKMREEIWSTTVYKFLCHKNCSFA